MKKPFFLFTSALIITCSLATATTFTDTPKIISFNEFSVEKIQEFINAKNSDFIIEIEKGDSFPLQFLTKTRVFSAMLDPNIKLKVEKTCYVRVVNNKCYMSEDLVNWEKAQRFMGGVATLQLSQSETNSGLVLETDIVPLKDAEEEE
ncbi:MAG: hypothetical protein NTX49_01200 [Chlamydiae bacterium]|nr:hypothetical protein [Chlamydiota bacterium]